MTFSPFLERDFLWGPPEGELRWMRPATQDEEPYLTNAIPGLAAPKILRLPFVDAPALYRSFAGLNPTPELILGFAKEWGMLGVAEPIPLSGWKRSTKGVTEWLGNPVIRGDQKGVPAGRGESLGRWRQEIAGMRDAVEVWDAIDKGDTRPLVKLIRVKRRRRRAVALFMRVEGTDENKRIQRHLIYDSAHRINRVLVVLGEGPEDTQILRAALFFVQKEVNRRLQDHARTHMVYATNPERLDLVNSMTNPATRRRLLSAPFDKTAERLRFAIIPTNLLGALWVQFSRVVDGDVVHVGCANCEKWIEISPRDNRQQRRRFCGSTCRVNWNRRHAG